MIQIKRTNDAFVGDGRRILVERLWPRGIKEALAASSSSRTSEESASGWRDDVLNCYPSDAGI